jgi:hypothetical protein
VTDHHDNPNNKKQLNRRDFMRVTSALGLGALFSRFGLIPPPGVDQTATPVPPTPKPPNLRGLLRFYARTSRPADANPVSIIMTGDVSFARDTTNAIYNRGGNWDYPLDQVSGWLSAADWAVCNHEFVLTPPNKFRPRSGGIRLRSNPDAAEAMKRAGFDMVSLANNHTWDYGADALQYTMETLDKTGIVTLGAGADGAKARQPVFTEIKGVKIGWLAYNQVDDPPLQNIVQEAKEYGRAWLDESTLEKEIADARKQCDVLIVQPHWGHEYNTVHHATQERLGAIMAVAGASLVIGHHPHVTQPTRVERNTLVCYSLGNFLFDQINRSGFAAWIRLDKYGIIDVHRLSVIPGVHPTWVR